MVIAQILEGFRQRSSWTDIRYVLQVCDLSAGRGWDNTIKKLTAEKELEENEKFDSKVKLLQEHYKDFLLVNNKAVELYFLERDSLDKLIDLLTFHQFEQNLFHKAYPFPLSEEGLEDVDSTQKLVEIVNTDDSLIIVFCSKRFFVERSEIDPSELEESTRKELIYYDKIIGIRENHRQFFDVVILSKHENTIEVRVDITTCPPSKCLTSKEVDKAFYETIQSFNALLKLKASLDKNANVFPLIDRLYESSEGQVTELGFVTDGGSIKHEKMRKKSTCLRIEPYHDAGKKAVHHITPYRLSVSWDSRISVNLNKAPELSLPGNVKELSRMPPYLGNFYIKNCICSKDYNFVFDKILSYLRKP